MASIIPAIITVLTMCAQLNAAADKEQADITIDDITHSAQRWALDSAGKLFQYQVRIFLANSGLTYNNHVRIADSKDTPPVPANVAHYHYFTDDMKSAYSDTSIPTTTQNKDYWDTRFAKCDPNGGATITQTCHEYAMSDTTRASGTYNYVFYDIAYVKAKDMKDIGLKSGSVRDKDILSYGDHSTLVLTVNGGKPSKLQWKWQGSGIYMYTPPTGNEWDTPMCTAGNHMTDVEQGKTPAQKGWQWDADYRKDPNVLTNY